MTDSQSTIPSDGSVANVESILHTRSSTTEAGMRAIDLAPAGGIAARVLPDRGLDIGQAWFAGQPLAWISAHGETPPLHDLTGMNWSEGFGGGLMVTCGLRNVGMPSEGHGLHGTYSHLAAEDVSVRTTEDSIVVAGRIVDAAEPQLTVHRTISTRAFTGVLRVEDITTNEGHTPAEAPLLYHCNFGFPFWSGEAELRTAPVSTVPRDVESEQALDLWNHPVPVTDAPEMVLEHKMTSPVAWAQIINRSLGIECTLEWNATELGWLNQWIDPNPGMAVLGLEPANCRTRGITFERADGTVPIIEPGASRSTSITFRVGPVSA